MGYVTSSYYKVCTEETTKFNYVAVGSAFERNETIIFILNIVSSTLSFLPSVSMILSSSNLPLKSNFTSIYSSISEDPTLSLPPSLSPSLLLSPSISSDLTSCSSIVSVFAEVGSLQVISPTS